ncbi:MAG: flagellar filament capping protein FliD [Bdellovibrionales bacterium]|nr:flagellar filament capping protein FliD [Bdellovibrionales bacterium]
MPPLVSFSGLASGIDSEALIDATIEARKAALITPKEDKIQEIQDTNQSLNDLKDLLLELKDLADEFREVNGSILSKIGSSSDETVASATADSTASNVSTTITVNTIAKTATHTFDDSDITDPEDAIAPGLTDTGNNEIEYLIGTGSEQETITLTVDTDTTLYDLTDQFNTQSSLAIATVVNIGTTDSPEYRLVVQTINEGTLKGQIAAPTVGTDITGVGRFTAGTLDAATDANFNVSGINDAITRSTNSVSDVIPGVTFNISKVGTTTITVSDDADATAASVQEFVDKYNEILAFVKEQNLITKESDEEDALNVFGPLAKTSIDDSAITSIRTVFSGSIYDSGSEIKGLYDLGLTTEQDGTLEFDVDAFKSALSKEPESVKNIWYNVAEPLGALTSAGGVIDPVTRFQGLIELGVKGNDEQVKSLQTSITRAQASIDKEADLLRQRFARLEKLTSDLQSQQSALASALAGLG